MKIYSILLIALLNIIIFINGLCAVSVLEVKSIQWFDIIDWDNDGKKDIVVYYTDGKFALLKNLSDSQDKIVFSKPIVFQVLENNKDLSSESILSSKKKSPFYDIINENINSFLDNNALIPNKMSNNKKKQTVKLQEKITKINSKKKSNNRKQNISVQKLKKQKKEFYKIAILSFVSEDKKNSNFGSLAWLNSGIPDLLSYELIQPSSQDLVMPLNESKKLSIRQASKKSRFVINGFYKMVNNNSIRITANIYKNNILQKSISVESKNDNEGIILLISHIGKQLYDEILKNK